MKGLFKNKYRIKTTRLPYWDYGGDGLYFITICTKNRECYFGDVIGGEMKLSNIGKMAQRFWLEIPKHFPFIELDEFKIMPNHLHGIIKIVETQNLASLRRGNKFGPQSKNLASIIRGFKIGVKKWATINNVNFDWQPRFYDHIIRDENDLNRIRKYIRENPARWEFDRNNQENLYM